MTSDQKAFIKRNAKNMTSKEIAEHLNMSTNTIRCYCTRKAIECKRIDRTPPSNAVFEVIGKARKPILRTQANGNLYTIPVYIVRCKLCGRTSKKEKRKIVSKKNCGQKCAHFKKQCSNKQKANAIKYEGKTAREWANIAGVTTTTIYKWLKRYDGDIKKYIPEYFKGE